MKAKLGIDYEACAAVNPRLVYGSISGYGQDGPASAKGAVDQIIQGVGGLMSITGPPGQGPVRAGIAVSDSAAGHQLAIGILIALYDRERTGLGQWVKVSLLEAMISFLDFQAVRWTIDGHVPDAGGQPPPDGAADGHLPGGRRLPQRRRPRRPAVGPPVRRRSATPELRRRPALRHAVRPLPQPPRAGRALDARFAHPPARRVDRHARRGRRSRAGRCYTIDEVFADPQVQHLAMLDRIDHPVRGPVDVIRNPITMSRSRRGRRRRRRRVPAGPVAEVLEALGIPDPG